MPEWLCDAELRADVLILLLSFIVPAVAVSCWLYYWNRLKRRKGTSEKRRTLKTIWIGILMYLLELLIPGENRSRHGHWTNRWMDEIEEFKRLAEIEELKKRPCKAKLPDAPDWRCACGRVNPAHTATCVCGKNMRDVPVSHKYPSPKATVWHCTCGRENPDYTFTCVCGQSKPVTAKPS